MIVLPRGGGAQVQGVGEEQVATAELAYSSAQHPRFGQLDFSATVGLWLEAGGSDFTRRLLSPYLPTEGFVFTPEELIELSDQISLLANRYAHLPKVSNGLDNLNTGFFRFREQHEGRQLVAELLGHFLDQAHVLHRDFLAVIHTYARRRYHQRRAELVDQLQQLADLRRTYASPPPKVRRRRLLLRQFQQQLQAFVSEAELAALSASSNSEQLDSLLERTDQRLRTTLDELTLSLQSEATALSALTADPTVTDPQLLRELNRRLTALITEIDESGLYQHPVVGSTSAATTPRQLKLLEQVLNQLTATEAHLAEFPAFHQRRSRWYALPARLRRILGSLRHLNPDQWLANFRVWYLDRCLEEQAVVAQLDPVDRDASGMPEVIYLTQPSEVEAQLGTLALTSRDLVLCTDPAEADAAATAAARTSAAVVLLAAPDDLTATPIALSGMRHAPLAFIQAFQPLRPPDWTATPIQQLSSGLSTESIGGALTLTLPQASCTPEGRYLVEHWYALILHPGPLILQHDWNEEQLTAALLADGNNDRFLAAVLIRAAEYARATPFDHAAFAALGEETRNRFRIAVSAATPHPLATVLAQQLAQALPSDHYLSVHQPWRDTYLPLVHTAPSGRKTVVLFDHQLPGNADPLTEVRRQEELTGAGFWLYVVSSKALWREAAVQDQLVQRLLGQPVPDQ